MQQETWIPIDDDPLLPAALAALGFIVKANVHLHPDAPTRAAHRVVTWMVAPQSSCGLHIGSQLIPAWRSGSILQSDPNHPLVACMLALQTRQRLSDWQCGLIERPHIVVLTAAKLARAIAPSTRSQSADISPQLGTESALASYDHAAAAITVGCGMSRIQQSRGCKITSQCGFDQSITAEKLLAIAAKIEADPKSSSTWQIGTSPVGEHPFLYALCAIKQARALGIAAEKKDPTLHLNSKSSNKTALVSQSIMDGNHNFKNHVHSHIR